MSEHLPARETKAPDPERIGIGRREAGGRSDYFTSFGQVK